MVEERIFAVSDIHGYGHLLKKLLLEANYQPAKDRLFLLGDYINKGPDSIGTLQYVQQLCADGAIALVGNNELNWLKSDDKQAEKWKHFILNLPAYAKTESFLFVHAGLRPGIRLKKQAIHDLTEISGHVFWEKEVSKRIVVFGHTPAFRLGAPCGQVAITTGKIAIDTGAGHGKTLTLVDVTKWQAYAIQTKKKSEVTVYSLQDSIFKQHVEESVLS